MLMRAKGESGELYPELSTAASRWRPRAVLGMWQGEESVSARATGGGGGAARRVGGSASKRWPGWPSTAASALNSGGDEQSRQAGRRKGKRDRFAISKNSRDLTVNQQ